MTLTEQVVNIYVYCTIAILFLHGLRILQQTQSKFTICDNSCLWLVELLMTSGYKLNLCHQYHINKTATF
jgi:hypothetical protein